MITRTHEPSIDMQVDVRGLPLRYRQFGEGRLIVLFTGWALDSRLMTYHFEPIFARRQGWRRIYPDMPGMGRTPAADWITSQDDMLTVALELIEAIAPRERPVVVGASWGAYVALGIAYHRARQLDGLMLVVPAVYGDRALRDLPAHQVLVANPDLVATLAADEVQWAEIGVVQSRESLAAFRETIKPALAVADFPFLERVAERYEFSFAAHQLPEPVGAPALILAGRQDSLCGYRDAWPLLERMPRATYAALDRAGHGLEDEQRSLFEALTGEWLDRVEEYAARPAP
jgi:pimeloyl-ACP methyl ester carboxylesterase